MHPARLFVAVSLATLTLVAPLGTARQAPPEVPMGGFVDSILWSVQPSTSQALADLESGALDLYTGQLATASALTTLRSNPALQAVDTSGRNYDLWVNPVPIADPNQFNPFALQDVRRAMNYLVDRNHINDEVFEGHGFVHAALFQPRSPEVARDPFFFGDLERSYAFDADRAEQMIFDAMSGAGATFDGTWKWQGNPIVINFVQRIEDVRFDIATYVASQLESVGFTVNLMPMTAGQAFAIVYFGPPDTGAWSLYTESFALSIEAWPDDWLADFHTSFSGETIWEQYSASPELEDVAQRLLNGRYATVEERQALVEAGVPLAIEESVRVWLISSVTSAASDRVVAFVHDSAFGLFGPFVPRTARFRDVGGTLRIGQQLQLFNPYQPWRGAQGGPDFLVTSSFADPGIATHPHTGEALPVRAQFEVETAGPSASMPVPSDAIVYDTATNSWTPVAPGTNAISKVSFDYAFGVWHHGVPVTMNDVLAHVALLERRGRGDISERDSQAATVEERFFFLPLLRGLRVVDSDTLEVYVDAWNLDPGVTAAGADVWPAVPWEVSELAMATTLHDHTRVSINAADRDGLTQIDLTRGATLGFMDRELSDGNVTVAGDGVSRPPGFAEFIDRAEAEARWAAITSWRASQGHYFPSNGPFSLRSVDFGSRQVFVDRFAAYPFRADRWDSLINPNVVDVTVRPPNTVVQGDEATVRVTTSIAGVAYDDAVLRYRIVNEADRTVVLEGVPTLAAHGRWRIDLTPSFTASLSPGSYLVEVAARPPVAP